jgi:hypothetical protein
MLPDYLKRKNTQASVGRGAKRGLHFSNRVSFELNQAVKCSGIIALVIAVKHQAIWGAYGAIAKLGSRPC